MKEIILEYLENDLLNGQHEGGLTAEDDLLMSGMIDSLGIMKLVGFVEERFEIKVPPQDILIEHFMTVQAIEDYIQTQK